MRSSAAYITDRDHLWHDRHRRLDVSLHRQTLLFSFQLSFQLFFQSDMTCFFGIRTGFSKVHKQQSPDDNEGMGIDVWSWVVTGGKKTWID